jgi:hypothetical protein
LPVSFGDRFRFGSGGSFGNALLLAFLTSGPELDSGAARDEREVTR